MKKTILWGAVLFTIYSCVFAQKYPANITTKDGVIVVENPSYPSKGKYNLKLNKMFVIGDENNSAKYILSNPYNIETDRSGNLYVYDLQSKIFVFDKSGNYLRQFGQRGKGPGDFDSPSYFKITSDNKIIINDAQNLRVCILDLNGRYIDGFNNNKYYRNLRIDKDNNIYSENNSRDLTGLTEKMKYMPVIKNICKYDKLNKTWIKIREFDGEAHKMMRKGNAVVGGEIDNKFFGQISPDNKIYTGNENNYQINIYATDGKMVRMFKREYTKKVKRDYKENEDNTRYEPALEDIIQFDDDNNCWIMLNKEKDAAFYTYDIFSKEGVYIMQVISEHKILLLKNNMASEITDNPNISPLIVIYKYSLVKQK